MLIFEFCTVRRVLFNITGSRFMNIIYRHILYTVRILTDLTMYIQSELLLSLTNTWPRLKQVKHCFKQEKQTSKQKWKQANKQTSKQTNKSKIRVASLMCFPPSFLTRFTISLCEFSYTTQEANHKNQTVTGTRTTHTTALSEKKVPLSPPYTNTPLHTAKIKACFSEHTDLFMWNNSETSITVFFSKT